MKKYFLAAVAATWALNAQEIAKIGLGRSWRNGTIGAISELVYKNQLGNGEYTLTVDENTYRIFVVREPGLQVRFADGWAPRGQEGKWLYLPKDAAIWGYTPQKRASIDGYTYLIGMVAVDKCGNLLALEEGVRIRSRHRGNEVPRSRRRTRTRENGGILPSHPSTYWEKRRGGILPPQTNLSQERGSFPVPPPKMPNWKKIALWGAIPAALLRAYGAYRLLGAPSGKPLAGHEINQ